MAPQGTLLVHRLLLGPVLIVGATLTPPMTMLIGALPLAGEMLVHGVQEPDRVRREDC